MREKVIWSQRQRLELRCHKAVNARIPQELEKERKDSSLDIQKKHGPADTNLAFWPTELQENKYLLF